MIMQTLVFWMVDSLRVARLVEIKVSKLNLSSSDRYLQLQLYHPLFLVI